MKRKICVVTGSRAEYGLLRPLMEQIREDNELLLQVAVTGMHLCEEFGMTYKEIEKHAFVIDEKVNMPLESDTPVGILDSMSAGMSAFARSFERLNPDIVVVLGDRFEIFSAALSACVSRIPLAHINGGELTKGAFDDALRHSITKMSHLHFTSADEYTRRVIQLGEDPQAVFTAGALGLDNIKKLKLLDKTTLESELDFKFNKRNLLVTFHPVTLEDNTSQQQFQNLLEVLDELKDTNIIFTKANADTYGRIINKMIDEYTARHKANTKAFVSMGQLKYLSAMKFADAVVGNSSSGIIEAVNFKTGTINIGDRQQGRIKTSNIIDCEPEKQSIKTAFEKLYSKEFQDSLKHAQSPYGEGNAAEKIKEVLKTFDLNNIIKKGFWDLP